VKVAVRTLAELGEDVVLAPERWVAALDVGDGVPLGELVVERRERAVERDAVVLDTTHAKDGLLDVHAALRVASSAKSAKKSARAGEIIVSRLRPYLRQIALVHPKALATVSGRALAVSTEFYVLAPRESGGDLGFLLPFLLGVDAQRTLAAAQEGGHRPRVPRASLLALRVPKELLRRRKRVSAEVNTALGALYDANAHFQALLAAPSGP
jgi:hypothetical protein